MKGNTMTGRDLKRAKANSNRAIEERASKQLHRIWELEAALSALVKYWRAGEPVHGPAFEELFDRAEAALSVDGSNKR